jgi:hypothetical protein
MLQPAEAGFIEFSLNLFSAVNWRIVQIEHIASCDNRSLVRTCNSFE